ncbi:DUF1987 domain-containing protein [Chrysiogenes arsenatis]|uniref:DUF1987 domain-containing protein n=1 Tax=Chrysiogenes arsenatis TaxID=309797 RepID=UPI000414CD9F|nr:DUF1987 domain-containing protein [Chrysiogenes arsenatis]
MEPIHREATTSTPTIHFDPVQHVLQISGESYPENAIAYYAPLIDALSTYLGEPAANLTIKLNVRYLNTSSVKSLMDIFDIADEAHRRGQTVEVYWYHDIDDDRSLQIAEEFSEDLTLPFHTEALSNGNTV